MTEKEKQIEEMAKVIENAITETSSEKAPANASEARCEAEALYFAGYRKQSEVAKEFVDRLILELIALRSEEFDGKELAINGKTYKYLVMRAKEIAAEYGVEVEK